MRYQTHSRKSFFLTLTQIGLVCLFIFNGILLLPQTVKAEGETSTPMPTATPTVTNTPPSPVEVASTFNWLSYPEEATALASARSMAILAGKFINYGLVDASSCAYNGLLENGAANPCGETVAHNAVILWQNQFDQAILEASRQANVPPFVLKNVIIQESQLWPSSHPTIYGYSEYGLGHVTQMGADTLLRWNTDFYNEFCTSVYSPDTCRERYALLPAHQQAVLRGAVLRILDADCSNCPGFVDLQKARASIFTIASVLKANRRHTEWVIEGITGKSASGRIEEVQLWRLTLAGYNAGPGCLATALYNNNRAGLSISWKNVSSQFDKGCAPAIDYVDDVTRIYATVPEVLASASTDASRAAAMVFMVAPHLQPLATPTPTVATTATMTAEPDTLEIANSTEILSGKTEVPGVGIEPPSTEILPIETEVSVTETSPASSGGEYPSVPIDETDVPLAGGEGASEPQSNPGEIVLKFNGFIAELFAKNVFSSVDAIVEQKVDVLNAVIIKVPEDNLPEALVKLNNNLLVDYAEPNFMVSAFYTPNDPEFSSQSYLGSIQVPEAWDIAHGDGVVVAVLDTGMELSHPDLDGANWINSGEFGLDEYGLDRQSNGLDDDKNGYVDDWVGWNFVDGSNSIFDNHGHGTHVAGLIGARMDNNLGIAGVAPDVTIMPLKVLDASGQGSYTGVAEAITYAVDNGANIINLGFGGVAQSDILKAAIDYAESHGVLVVAAAGNTGSNTLMYPASYPYVLSVGAVSSDLNWASFSTFGSEINLVSPGVGVYSTLLGGSYGLMSGTSMSSAQVSGVAALLASSPQFDTANKVRVALLGSVHDLGDPGWDIYYGDGLVRALDALNFVPTGVPTPTFTPPPVDTPGPGAGGVNAMAIEQLWGTAQTCTYGITAPGNSIDLAFNNQSATCTGTFGNTPGSWVYTAIQDTTLPSIVSTTLNIQFGATIGNDTISLDVYDGVGWTPVTSFNTNTPFALYSYDVSAILDTTTKVNAAQVRLLGTNRQGAADNITFTMDEIRLDVTDVSNTPPVVNITAPANGSSFSQGASITFTGTATDVEDGNLNASLQWTSSILGAIGTGANFSTSSLSVGTHTITAQVTDSGGLTGNDSISVTITVVANTPPTVNITSPADGSSFTQGSSINFTGTSNDTQDGNISANLQWSSSLDGGVGTGASFSTSSLSVGVHTITAQVTDSGGQTGNDSISVTITVAATNPHGGYGALTDQCASCHRAHTAETNRLISYPNSPLTDNTFCLSCHSSGAVTVSTHSNIDEPGTQESFELLCVQCHEPHGSSNLANVRSDIRVQQNPSIITTGPVVFTSLTGANSLDEVDSALPESVASNVDDLCVTCHVNASRPGSGTPLLHTGGGNHSGGADYRGQDCTACHAHSADNDPNTKDGFMGASCRGCHSAPQGPRRAVAGASGDFVRSSHHVTGSDAVTDADCEVCHDQSDHQAGTVRLFNADNSATVYIMDGVSNETKYENFCVSCHDGNGAQKEATPLAPFSDASTPPIVDVTAWNSASHNVSASIGSCVNCHDNGHGSNKVSLLAPWNYTDDGDLNDPMQQEERFCYTCHGSAGPASSDIASNFGLPTNWANRTIGTNGLANLNDRHDVAATDQARSSSKIECVDCHNPHTATAANPLIADPDPTDGRSPSTPNAYFPGDNFQSRWCLDCHDLTLPPGVVDGHVDGNNNPDGLVNVMAYWDGANNGDDTHGARNGNVGSITGVYWNVDITMQCFDCHTYHVADVSGILPSQGGNSNLFHLKAVTYSEDGLTPLTTNAPGIYNGTFSYENSQANPFVSDWVDGYAYCNTCHDGAQMQSGADNCSRCHMHGSRY